MNILRNNMRWNVALFLRRGDLGVFAAVIMILKLFDSPMENEFHFTEERQSQHTFPVRVSPLALTNRHPHKIRINHTKLPSQFFSNPRSMPDLQPSIRGPSLEVWKRHRERTECSEESGSKEATWSLKDYKSVDRRSTREQERKIHDLFVQGEDMGITFSKLPIKRLHNKVKESERVYFKKIYTEPSQHTHGVLYVKRERGLGMSKLQVIKARQGIGIRRNNHPVATLREIKRQCN